jgi:predicted nucleic acid-binding protein
VRVYAESNFVLELVLEQEQHAACAEFVERAERGELALVLPAFCLFEPFTTLHRRQRERQDLHDALQKELGQIARTQAFAHEVSASPLPALLVRSTQAAAVQFDAVLERLLRVAQVLPLTAVLLGEARRTRDAYGLKLPDAIVLASILGDLAGNSSPSCFLNRNTKDFDDPAIVSALTDRACRMLGSFDNGIQYALAQLRATATPE